MSLLVVFIPARHRLGARGAESPAPGEGRPGREYRYVTTPDGLSLSGHGTSSAALLPKAETVVVVLDDADVSWHRVALPRAPAARLKAALAGVLEEALLEDADGVHLAVAPAATPGDATWVAAVDRAWLRGELAALQKARVFVDRVVPCAWPDDPAAVHISEPDGAVADETGRNLRLTWAHTGGVAVLPLHGGLARAMLPLPLPAGVRVSASPAAAQFAERWLGTRVHVLSVEQRMLQAARTLWNLRQFELARKTRGVRALRDGWRKFRSDRWRPVRWGVIALLGAQLAGLNISAAQQRSHVEQKRAEAVTILQSAFPSVRAVLDAPLQMQREVQTLRARAGRPGDADMEAMLHAAASAWPAGRPAAAEVQFDVGRLTLSVPDWDESQARQFGAQLRSAGWRVDAADGRMALSRAPGDSL